MDGNTIPFPSLAPAQGTQAQSSAGLPFGPEEMAAAALRAATPSTPAHSTSIPLNLQPNLRTFQPAPLNERPAPVGKGNARGQGIGNAIIGVANAITGVATAEGNKKKLQLATDTHTLLQSQQAIDQAQQVLQNDPNNSQAKEAIDHNKNIMNGILADKKTRDAIAKGFKIDFTDPQANNTPDHQAVNQGKEMAEKSNSLADQFSKAVPTEMQQNPQAVARYTAMQEQNKQALEYAKAVDPATIRAAGAERVEATRASTALIMENNRNMQAMDRLKQANDYAIARAEKTNDLTTARELKMINARRGSAISEFQQKLNIVNSDPRYLSQYVTQTRTRWESAINSYATQIAQNNTERDKLSEEDYNKNLGRIQQLDATNRALIANKQMDEQLRDAQLNTFSVLAGNNPAYNGGKGGPPSSDTQSDTDTINDSENPDSYVFDSSSPQ